MSSSGKSAGGASTPLQDQLVTVAVASIDWQAIPQTFKHLQVIFECKSDAVGNVEDLQLTLNARSVAGDYSPAFVGAYGIDGSAVTLNPSAPNTYVKLGDNVGTTQDANHRLSGEFLIPDYTNATTGKTVNGRYVALADVAAVFLGGAIFRHAEAVTRITIKSAVGNLDVGSRFSLYGIG